MCLAVPLEYAVHVTIPRLRGLEGDELHGGNQGEAGRLRSSGPGFSFNLDDFDGVARETWFSKLSGCPTSQF
jgi:hypothetical protein